MERRYDLLKLDTSKMQVILATDVGSTTTKARFFKKIDGHWRFICAGEAPTTVEKPFEDVTMGLRNAIREVEELTGHKILRDDGQGICLLYTSPSPRDLSTSRMPSSA